jgi:hypothetical protein
MVRNSVCGSHVVDKFFRYGAYKIQNVVEDLQRDTVYGKHGGQDTLVLVYQKCTCELVVERERRLIYQKTTFARTMPPLFQKNSWVDSPRNFLENF